MTTETQPARMGDDLPDWAIAQAFREAASMTGFIAPNIAEGMRIRARELSAHGGDGGGDRAALNYLMQQFDAEVFVCGKCGHEAATKNCDSAIYLRDYLATQQPASGEISDAVVLEALRKHIADNFTTQAKFALSLRVSESYVSDVLNKRREIPADWVYPLGFQKAGWERFEQWPHGLPKFTTHATAAHGSSGEGTVKPSECAEACPPMQVCDYCQDVPVWRREWQGSGPQRGFHIREGTRLHNAPIVAYLGDQIGGDAVDALIEAHNSSVQRDAAPPTSASDAEVEAWRGAFVKGYMEAALVHAHSSTPVSALQHHASLAADKLVVGGDS